MNIRYSVPSPAMAKFYLNKSFEFAQTIDQEKVKSMLNRKISDEEKAWIEETELKRFTFICDEMLKSTDDEIRVELPRFLMYRGLKELDEAHTAMMSIHI